MTFLALLSEGSCLIFRTDSLVLLVLSLMALKYFKFVGIYCAKTIYLKKCVQKYKICHVMRESGGECCHGHTIYICLFSCYCPSNLLYRNSAESCSPNRIFPLFFPFYVAFPFDRWCRFVLWLSFFLLMSTLSHSKYTCHSTLSLHHAYLTCFFPSFFLVFLVAGTTNGTTAPDRPGVSLDIDTSYCVTIP